MLLSKSELDAEQFIFGAADVALTYPLGLSDVKIGIDVATVPAEVEKDAVVVTVESYFTRIVSPVDHAPSAVARSVAAFAQVS